MIKTNRMDDYIFKKLQEINYKMQIHRGCASDRFYSCAKEIQHHILPNISVENILSTNYCILSKKEFQNMKNDIAIVVKGGFRVIRRNSTIAKYIQFLKDLELNEESRRRILLGD